MEPFVRDMLNWLVLHAGQYGAYIGICGVLLLSGFGLPLPEDIPLLLAGLLCGLGHADLRIMIPMAFAAVLGADLVVYTLGRVYGHHIRKLPLLRRYLTEARLARAERAFHDHGGKTLFVGRFLPGLRTPIFFTAGTFKIPFWKMLVFDGGAALLSVPAIVMVGYFGGAHFDKVKQITGLTQLGISGILIIVVLVVILIKVRRRRRQAAFSG